MGMVLKLKPGKVEAYKRLHANVWPDILATITRCTIHNYSIFPKQPDNLLFGHWEYTGEDFDADAAIMAADPRTLEWWAMMEEVFHHD